MVFPGLMSYTNEAEVSIKKKLNSINGTAPYTSLGITHIKIEDLFIL